MSRITELLRNLEDSKNLEDVGEEPIYDAIFNDPQNDDEQFDSWPTQAEVTENLKPIHDSNNYDQQCGSCVKFQNMNLASKYGWCKFMGGVILVTNSICQRYKQRKPDPWAIKNP